MSEFLIEDGVLIRYYGNDEHVIIPVSVQKIGGAAFAGCTSLADISIPNSVSVIDAAAFAGCTSLTDISIPESVTVIGEYAFDGCEKLTNVNIPDSVTQIGERAFANCTSLESVSITKNVTEIGKGAFVGTPYQRLRDLKGVKAIRALLSIKVNQAWERRRSMVRHIISRLMYNHGAV